MKIGYVGQIYSRTVILVPFSKKYSIFSSAFLIPTIHDKISPMKKILLIPILILALSPTSAFALTKSSNYEDFTSWYQREYEEEILPYTATAIIETETYEPLHYHAEQRIIPTASLAKLITAGALVLYPQTWTEPLTFLESDNETSLRPWVNPEDIIPIIHLNEGDTITRLDAFAGMLIASANNAPYALARTVAYNMEEFVSVMNAVANDWGMTNTSLVEPSGLSLENLSTAQDLALGGCKAFENEQIAKYSGYSFHKLETALGEEKIFTHTLYGLRGDLNYEMYRTAKTGYLDETGYHVVAQLITPTKKEVCATVLGADTRQRLDEVLQAMRIWVDEMYF